MERLTTARGTSARRGLAWIAGLAATALALTIGTVLALFAAATVVIMALMTSALLALSALAMRARRAVHKPADPTLIEAHRTGGHSWVAYGWNERRS